MNPAWRMAGWLPSNWQGGQGGGGPAPEGAVTHDDFASVSQLTQAATLGQTSDKLREVIGKLRPALAAALLAPLAALSAIDPGTYLRDVPPYTPLSNLVSAAGVVTQSEYSGFTNRTETVKRCKDDLRVYRRKKDCWTWTNWASPGATADAPADFLAYMNSPASEPIHYERVAHAWYGAVMFRPDGSVKYRQAEIPPGDGEFATSLNFAMTAYDGTGTNELFRFGANATRTNAVDETLVAWGELPGMNPYVRIATTDFVDSGLSLKVDETDFDSATNDLWNAKSGGGGGMLMYPKYLWTMTVADSYPEEAKMYYEQAYGPSACSSVRDGQLHSRNYDWNFDSSCVFVVSTLAGPGRLASVGVGGVGTNLTEEIVSSGTRTKWYKAVPGHMLDGINERGVCVNVNVISSHSHTNGWHGNPDADGIHCLAAVRWVLDNAESAEAAARALADRVYVPQAALDRGYSFHYMISDATSTWIAEDGWCSNFTGRVAMTNVRSLDADDPCGTGRERLALLRAGGSITDAWYTKAYTDEASKRLSEFVETGTETPAELEAAWQTAHDAWAAKDREEHRDETPGGKSWWQTVHTSVYDLSAKTLRVAVQETDDWYVFALPASGGGGGDDPAFSNRVAGIVQDFRKQTYSDTRSAYGAGVYRWYLWRVGERESGTVLDYNRYREYEGLWSGHAAVGGGLSVYVYMYASWDADANTWSWTPVIVYPKSAGGGRVTLESFTGKTHTYELGAPFGTVVLEAEERYPYLVEWDVVDLVTGRIHDSEDATWERTVALVASVTNHPWSSDRITTEDGKMWQMADGRVFEDLVPRTEWNNPDNDEHLVPSGAPNHWRYDDEWYSAFLWFEGTVGDSGTWRYCTTDDTGVYTNYEISAEGDGLETVVFPDEPEHLYRTDFPGGPTVTKNVVYDTGDSGPSRLYSEDRRFFQDGYGVVMHVVPEHFDWFDQERWRSFMWTDDGDRGIMWTCDEVDWYGYQYCVWYGAWDWEEYAPGDGEKKWWYCVWLGDSYFDPIVSSDAPEDASQIGFVVHDDPFDESTPEVKIVLTHLHVPAENVRTRQVAYLERDKDGDISAFTIGIRGDESDVGVLSLSVGLINSARNMASTAIGFGNDVTEPCALAVGSENRVAGNSSIGLGIETSVPHNYAFAWSGAGGEYETHGEGTFNVNPKDGADGFFIGGKRLLDCVSGRYRDITNLEYVVTNTLRKPTPWAPVDPSGNPISATVSWGNYGNQFWGLMWNGSYSAGVSESAYDPNATDVTFYNNCSATREWMTVVETNAFTRLATLDDFRGPALTAAVEAVMWEYRKISDPVCSNDVQFVADRLYVPLHPGDVSYTLTHDGANTWSLYVNRGGGSSFSTTGAGGADALYVSFGSGYYATRYDYKARAGETFCTFETMTNWVDRFVHPRTGASMSVAARGPQFPAGTIIDYAGEECPDGWLFCDGAAYLREDFPALFGAIGTKYGSASAEDFKVPDFRSADGVRRIIRR